MQAANTSLTGGSTPALEGYDREVVIINTLRVAKLYLIRGGQEVVCLPGCTLHQLERALEPLGREPHSVIGSSCIGASVIGGICNNSGGALTRRGPAFTQLALFAGLNERGELGLTNHLGLKLGENAEEILTRLDRGAFTDADVDISIDRVGSDRTYAERVRDVDANSPARFNSDPRCLYEASGSAGRLAIFAVRVDTFQKCTSTKTFYIGTNDPGKLTALRRAVLQGFHSLPISGEYIHRGTFDLAEHYGKDIFLFIHHFGTSRLPGLLAMKAWLDSLAVRLHSRTAGLADRVMQHLARLFPSHLPRRMKEFRDRFEHHLLLKVADQGVDEARSYLNSIYPSTDGDFFECTEVEAKKAFLHRFVAAGAAVRYRDLHRDKVEEIVALDVALRRNDDDWFESLPPTLDSKIEFRLYYGHFLCHVFHQDYIVRKGCEVDSIKASLCALLDVRGAKYPAEHNVGHEYEAGAALKEFYRSLDPTNSFNPGTGATSPLAYWGVQGRPGTAESDPFLTAPIPSTSVHDH